MSEKSTSSNSNSFNKEQSSTQSADRKASKRNNSNSAGNYDRGTNATRSRKGQSKTSSFKTNKPKKAQSRDVEKQKKKTEQNTSKNETSANNSQSDKLQKVLANNGVGSRREMERWISEGRVSVNGKVAEIGDRVSSNDQIRVDGKLVSRQKERSACRVLMLNKPEGLICSAKDPEGRPTVFDRLPKLVGERWIAIGRLDINTSGLLLFTNDGELANRLMHPSYEIEREYAVRIFGEVTPQKLRNLANGVELEDGPAKFNSIHVRPNDDDSLNHWYNVTLSEGRNREVRRLWESQDLKVSRLMRVRYGNIEMFKRLPQGAWLELDLSNVNQLRDMAKLPHETETKVHQAESLDHTTLSRMRRSVRKHKQNKISTQRQRSKAHIKK